MGTAYERNHFHGIRSPDSNFQDNLTNGQENFKVSESDITDINALNALTSTVYSITEHRASVPLSL